MKLILNGNIFINDDKVVLDNLEISDKKESFANEYDINNYIENCDVCGFCDFEDDYDEDRFELEEFMDDIVEDYTDIIWEMGDTPEDINEMLLSFFKEIIAECC